MSDSNDIYSDLIDYHRKFEEIPGRQHLLCPKEDDEDQEDYDSPEEDGAGTTAAEKQRRVADFERRLNITYRLCLLLALDNDEVGSWRGEWMQRVEKTLRSCDSCVRNWHFRRKGFLSKIAEFLQNEDSLRVVNAALTKFDKVRIDEGLENAKKILAEHGAISVGKLAGYDAASLMALYEALCCMAYLSVPENRATFNVVFRTMQERKPLRMNGSLLPTMTHFLFEDDAYRQRYARAAWEQIPQKSMTVEHFEFAVHEYLQSAGQAVANPDAPPAQIQLFWEGFVMILQTMGEDLVMHHLRGVQVLPSGRNNGVWHLATQHMDLCASTAALAPVLAGFSMLMERSPRAFWEEFAEVSPSSVAEQIIKARAFKALLSESQVVNTSTPDDKDSNVPLSVAWVRSFIEALPVSRKPDACQSLLYHLFECLRTDASIGMAGQAACTRAGLDALNSTISAFLDPGYKIKPATSLIFIDQILNVTIKYKDVINASSELKRDDRMNMGISDTALSLIRSSLTLDAKALQEEYSAINQLGKVQQSVNRQSSRLWASFLEALWPGKVDLAKAMLAATIPLISIEKFRPAKRCALDNVKKNFNATFEKTAAEVGRLIERLTDFNGDAIKALCQDPSTIRALVPSLVHGEDPINVAGLAFIKAATDTDDRSAAVTQMLTDYMSPFLQAYTFATNTVVNSPNKPWTPFPQMLLYSTCILDNLCNTSNGLLRRRDVDMSERGAVLSWWHSQWKSLDFAFKETRAWSQEVDNTTMQNFCRRAMEHADGLLAQDGVLASALRPNTSIQVAGDEKTTMVELLDLPRKSSHGLSLMLKLRDPYLVSVCVAVLGRLLRRMRDYGIELPKQTVNDIMDACTRGPDGKYIGQTNLTDQQRAELRKSLGADEAEVEYLGKSSASEEAKKALKKQSKLDAWSKSGDGSRPSTASSVASLSSKDNIRDLSRTIDSRRSALDKIKAKHAPPKVDEATVLANRASIKAKREKERLEKEKEKQKFLAAQRGEGSALQGLSGVAGKDFGQQKSEIMVDSSDEEEDDDSDGGADDLIRRAKAGRKAMDDVEKRRRRALLETQRGPVKKTKIQRSAKDMRARLIPPMDVLHQAILEWDIFHKGNDPPNGYQCLSVANTYQDPKRYKDTFFPLLVNEAWRSFVTDKNETTSKPFGVKVVSRMTVDRFFEVTIGMPVAEIKDRKASEGDIMLISKGENPLSDSDQPHCLARVHKTAFKREMFEVTFRMSNRNNPVVPLVMPGSEFFAVRITNMTTIEREYAALESLQYYDLMDEILKAEPSPILTYGEEAVQRAMSNWSLNPGQAKAILNAKENDGFTLVQGPPGTGKTKTIVAMVGALLTHTFGPSGVPIHQPHGLGQSNGQGMQKKLLVCAPSNAAVDELVLRLKAGVKTLSGSFHKINVVRLGRSDAISAGVKDVTLEELVRAKMEGAKEEGGMSAREKLHLEAQEIKKQVAGLREAQEVARNADDRNTAMKIQRQLDELRQKQSRIGARIEADKESGNTAARENEIRKRQIQQEILNSAHVLCSTLSGSGHEMFKNLNVEFETVIIDEAAQCVELSALIPLKYGASKCILVGDPKQLPPTVLSQSAARYGYDQSLFVRMQQNHPGDVHLLDRQYRMHPEISLFPSQEFYEGRLVDGDDMDELRRQPWHESKLLGPYRFFDVKGLQERGRKGQSLVNLEELKVAMQLYDRFRGEYQGVDLKGKIGIITPYKAQLNELRERFSHRYGEGVKEYIEFNTTDAFQGRECEIIIFSCVRASPTGGIGFMTDIRRMNVGLTRAKSSLWILGDSKALYQGEFWAKLIDNAKARDRYSSGDILSLLKRPLEKLPPSAFKNAGVKKVKSEPSPPLKDVSPAIKEEDTVMTDAYSAAEERTPLQLPSRQPPPQPTMPPTYTLVDHGSTARAAAHGSLGIGGPDGKGEATPGIGRGAGADPPLIQHQKRPRPRSPSGDGAPPAKRVPSGPAKPQRPVVNPPRRAPKPPQDPSAMEVLGMTPPQRLPAPSNDNQNSRPQVPRPAPRAGGPLVAPPRKKNRDPDPFIQRKRPHKR